LAKAVDWIGQAASALDFAHARGVVHRDVKPQNMLFDADGRLVVADLGIARAAYEDSLTASGELLGTASYISPEQAMGEAATPASDRYSLAIVAYELLTGSRPFGGGSFAEQALQQVESEPQAPSERAPGLPPAVDDVLLRGLAKDPERRWESASDFASALSQALDRPPAAKPVTETHAEAPPAPPPAPPERRAATLIDPDRMWPREAPAPRSRFRIPLLALAACVVLALIAGAAIVATGGDDGERATKEQRRADRASTSAKAKRTARSRQRRTEARKSPSRSAAPQAPAATAPAAPAPDSTSGTSSASALNDQGFRLMQAGRYDEAIPVLQRAVAAFARDSQELTYAYALYNLGHSLRLAGRPAEAVPLLERRLRFANQRGVVQRELAAARAAAG
jgi:tetratricopeptide (TPR) repeat protein